MTDDYTGCVQNILFAVFAHFISYHCFSTILGFFVPFIYLPDFVENNGIPRGHAAWLVCIIGKNILLIFVTGERLLVVGQKNDIVQIL